MAEKNKMIFNLLGIASAVAVGFASYKLFKIYQKGKQGEQKSSADGLKTITFTLTNNTTQNQTEYMFDSRAGKDNSNVGISPSIGFFNRELSDMPKKLVKIEFRTLSGVAPTPSPSPIPPTPQLADADVVAPLPPPALPKSNQAEAPFKMICADASGNSSTQQYTPLISPNQFQGGITSVNFNDKILDGECYMAYTMFPKSKVAMVIYYEDTPSPLDKKKKKKRNRKEDRKTQKVATDYSKQTEGILEGMGM